MAKRAALAFLGVASIVILGSSLVGTEVAALAFAFLGVAFPVILMVLGAGRGGRLGSARWPILGLLILLELCVVGMLAFRGRVLDAGYVLGLPVPAAIQLYGAFLAPLLVVAFGFAWSFRDFGVSREGARRLREIAGSRPDSS